MPFREPHLYIMLVNRAVGGGLEMLKGLTTYSVHITIQEQRLSFPPDAYHVDKRSGCKEILLFLSDGCMAQRGRCPGGRPSVSSNPVAILAQAVSAQNFST